MRQNAPHTNTTAMPVRRISTGLAASVSHEPRLPSRNHANIGRLRLAVVGGIASAGALLGGLLMTATERPTRPDFVMSGNVLRNGQEIKVLGAVTLRCIEDDSRGAVVTWGARLLAGKNPFKMRTQEVKDVEASLVMENCADTVALVHEHPQTITEEIVDAANLVPQSAPSEAQQAEAVRVQNEIIEVMGSLPVIPVG